MTLLFILLLLVVVHIGVIKHKRIDWGKSWVNWLDGFNRLYCRLIHGFYSDALQLPQQGSALIAANHISGLDPLLLIAASNRPLRFMIAREQYHRFGLRWLFDAVGCIPVDRIKHPEKSLREAFRALDAGEVVVIFPYGHIYLESDRHREIKGGIALLAKRSQSPVYPVRISGVTAKGAVIFSVFIPSRSSIAVFPHHDINEMHEDDLLKLLDQQLNYQ